MGASAAERHWMMDLGLGRWSLLAAMLEKRQVAGAAYLICGGIAVGALQSLQEGVAAADSEAGGAGMGEVGRWTNSPWSLILTRL